MGLDSATYSGLALIRYIYLQPLISLALALAQPTATVSSALEYYHHGLLSDCEHHVCCP